MCLAVPLRIESIDGTRAVCDACGVSRDVRLDLVPLAKFGDYILSHAGFAIEILDPAQAQENLAAIREAFDAGRV